MSKEKVQCSEISINIVDKLIAGKGFTERTLSELMGKSSQWYYAVKKRAKNGYVKIKLCDAKKLADILGLGGAIQDLSDGKNKYYSPVRFDHSEKARSLFEKLLPTRAELLSELFDYIDQAKDERIIGDLRVFVSRNRLLRRRASKAEKYWCNTLFVSELGKQLMEKIDDWSIDDVQDSYFRHKKSLEGKSPEFVISEEKKYLKDVVSRRLKRFEDVFLPKKIQKSIAEKCVEKCADFLFSYFETAPMSLEIMDRVEQLKDGIL